jgi:hypothetical protein
VLATEAWWLVHWQLLANSTTHGDEQKVLRGGQVRMGRFVASGSSEQTAWAFITQKCA